MCVEVFRWRPLARRDLDGVMAVADIVHPAYPERRETFAEKLELAPDGCLALEAADGVLAGYAVALPWRRGEVVALDTLVGALPEPCNSLYVHDIAVLPAARGRSLAGAAVALLAAAAARRGLRAMTLTAVYGAEVVWARHGFRAVDDPALRLKLASYGAEACYLLRTLD